MKINVIRCILILLVILIHLTPFKYKYPDVQNAILAFVVPLFMFITGYLFNINKTWRQYAVYLRGLILTYIIFETSYAVLSFFLPIKDRIHELNISVILDKVFISPIGPYWYLHTMILCASIYYSIHRACRIFKIDCAISLSVLVSIILSYYSPLLGLMPPIAYFAGVIFRKYSNGFTSNGSFIAILLTIVTLSYGTFQNPEYATQLSYFSIILSACIIESLAWCVSWLPLKVIKVLNYVGANTLPIYLFHPIFTLSSKLLMDDIVKHGNILCFSILAITIATTGSLMLGHALDYVGLSMLLFKKKMIR